MTITTTKRKVGPYLGDGVSTIFPFDFKFFDKEDLLVIYADESGAERELALQTDYTVNKNVDQETVPGGNVILKKALPQGTRITLTSGMAYLQPTKLTNHGGFYPAVINDSLDRLTIFVQQLEEQVERAVKVTVSSGDKPDDLIAAIKNSESAARQSAESAHECETRAIEHAEIAKNAAEALEDGLQDLAGVKAEVEVLNNSISMLKIVGAIGTFCFSAPPAGWLLADGTEVPRSIYAQLFAAIGTTFGAGDGSTTFNLPDLRGEFIRGWDAGRGVDSGRTLGSAQGDAIRNITGSIMSINSPPSGAFTGGDVHDSISGATNGGGTTLNSFDASRVVPTANENRPRNTALAMFIFTGA